MLFLVVIALLHIQTAQCVKAIPGQPVPNADILDKLLSKYLGDSYHSELIDFIMGVPSQDRDANLTSANLDISILDVDTVRKIIDFAKQKYDNGVDKNARRSGYVDFPGDEAYAWHPYVVNKTFDLMKQSIYMTKEKINQTRPWREKYHTDFGYEIAILYGAATVILGKMEALIAQMKHFTKTHFFWYLVIYEQILTCSIDISDSVEKIFIVQDEYEQERGPRATLSPHANMSQEQIRLLMSDPKMLEELKKNDSNLQKFGP